MTLDLHIMANKMQMGSSNSNRRRQGCDVACLPPAVGGDMSVPSMLASAGIDATSVWPCLSRSLLAEASSLTAPWASLSSVCSLELVRTGKMGQWRSFSIGI